jgi:hypothetical protein
VLALALILGQALGLPEVENPIPEKIGFGHVLALAGAGGLLSGFRKLGASPAERERAISLGSVAGFGLGAVVNCLLLAVQVLSSL